MKNIESENKGFVINIQLSDEKWQHPYLVHLRTERLDPDTGDLIDFERSNYHQFETYERAYDFAIDTKNRIACQLPPEMNRPILIEDEVLMDTVKHIPYAIREARNTHESSLLAWVCQLRAGSVVDVHINQADRDGRVLAVLPPRGTKYGKLPRVLIEYVMPRGSTALVTIGCGPLSYGGLAKHKEWLHAIKTQMGYEGHTVTTKAEGRYGNEREGTIEILPICGQAQGGATWCFPVNPPIYLGGNGTEGNQNREHKYPVTNRKYRNIDYGDWGFKFTRPNWDSTNVDLNPWVARSQDFVS